MEENEPHKCDASNQFVAKYVPSSRSVLPLVLDSDEEVMTTQFEVSKLK